MDLGQEIDHAGLSLDLGWIALLAGRPETAVSELRAAAAVLEHAGEDGYLATVAAVLADVLDRLGEEEEAEQWTLVSQRVASPEDVEAQASWRSVMARVLARRGDAREALRLSAEALDWSRQSDGPHAIGTCLANRAEVLRFLGCPDDARPLFEEALDIFRRKGIIPLIERTRAELASLPAAD
jgi:tetratricopeptide (TPR) repeat protein